MDLRFLLSLIGVGGGEVCFSFLSKLDELVDDEAMDATEVSSQSLPDGDVCRKEEGGCW